MARRSGLGRGLGALIPAGAPSGETSVLRELPIGQIRANQFQPRKHFDEESLSSLVDSIRAVGILQPVLVRELDSGEFELIAGERRWRAAKRAGLQQIPALIQHADDVASLEQALVENVHRDDLNALDEAGAYQQLIEQFGLTHDDVARRVGRSRVTVTNALRLLQLPPSVQRRLRDGDLTAGHARALLGSPDRSLQERLAAEAVARQLSVRSVENEVRAAVNSARADTDSLTQGWSPASGVADPGGGEGSVPGGDLDDGGSARRRPGATALRALRPPGVHDLEELLEELLNTRVKVDMTARRGKLVIEFATLDDLERIYRVITGETST